MHHQKIYQVIYFIYFNFIKCTLVNQNKNDETMPKANSKSLSNLDCEEKISSFKFKNRILEKFNDENTSLELVKKMSENLSEKNSLQSSIREISACSVCGGFIEEKVISEGNKNFTLGVKLNDNSSKILTNNQADSVDIEKESKKTKESNSLFLQKSHDNCNFETSQDQISDLITVNNIPQSQAMDINEFQKIPKKGPKIIVISDYRTNFFSEEKKCKDSKIINPARFSGENIEKKHLQNEKESFSGLKTRRLKYPSNEYVESPEKNRMISSGSEKKNASDKIDSEQMKSCKFGEKIKPGQALDQIVGLLKDIYENKDKLLGIIEQDEFNFSIERERINTVTEIISLCLEEVHKQQIESLKPVNKQNPINHDLNNETKSVHQDLKNLSILQNEEQTCFLCTKEFENSEYGIFKEIKEKKLKSPMGRKGKTKFDEESEDEKKKEKVRERGIDINKRETTRGRAKRQIQKTGGKDSEIKRKKVSEKNYGVTKVNEMPNLIQVDDNMISNTNNSPQNPYSKSQLLSKMNDLTNEINTYFDSSPDEQERIVCYKNFYERLRIDCDFQENINDFSPAQLLKNTKIKDKTKILIYMRNKRRKYLMKNFKPNNIDFTKIDIQKIHDDLSHLDEKIKYLIDSGVESNLVDGKKVDICIFLNDIKQYCYCNENFLDSQLPEHLRISEIIYKLHENFAQNYDTLSDLVTLFTLIDFVAEGKLETETPSVYLTQKGHLDQNYTRLIFKKITFIRICYDKVFKTIYNFYPKDVFRFIYTNFERFICSTNSRSFHDTVFEGVINWGKISSYIDKNGEFTEKALLASNDKNSDNYYILDIDKITKDELCYQILSHLQNIYIFYDSSRKKYLFLIELLRCLANYPEPQNKWSRNENIIKIISSIIKETFDMINKKIVKTGQ